MKLRALALSGLAGLLVVACAPEADLDTEPDTPPVDKAPPAVGGSLTDAVGDESAPNDAAPGPVDGSFEVGSDGSDGDAGAADADIPDGTVVDAGADASPTCPNSSPPPVVTSIGPSPLPMVDGKTVIHVTGLSFTPCTTVRIQGTSGNWFSLPTTYVSPSKLEAPFGEGGIRAMYRDNVFQVFTPGGGETDGTLLRQMPVPKIATLDPPSISAGSPAITLSVSAPGLSGSVFVGTFDSGAVVYFDSTPLGDVVFTCPYGFDIWCRVSVTVPASLLTTARTAKVTVVNPNVEPSQPFNFEIQ